MKKIFLCFLSVVFIACNAVNKYDKSNFVGTKEIDDNLYLETYCVYKGGVYGRDTHTCYLTDSVSFRIYLGSEDDHEQINAFPMDDGIILVRKYDRNTNVTIEKEEYNLLILKQECKFE